MQVTHPKLNLMEYRRLFLEDYDKPIILYFK